MRQAMDIKKVLSSISDELRPERNINVQAAEFMELLRKSIRSNRIDADVFLGGSLAKGTNLRDVHDIDIFVRFARKHSDSDLSAKLEEVLKKSGFKYERIRGSRDYFQIKKGLVYEVIPVLKITNPSNARNIADISPLHVSYFKNKSINSGKSKKGKKMCDEVRLTKAFMRAAGVYGAESYIRGFSGHVVDLLILRYGSFTELAKAAVKWKDKQIIQLDRNRDSGNILLSMNSSKTTGPLIVVDPIQHGRNAAAAVSDESLEGFKKACSKFLQRPSKSFFYPLSEADVLHNAKKRFRNKCEYFIITVKPRKESKDIAGAKMLKIKEYLEAEITNGGFEIKWSWLKFGGDTGRIYLGIKKGALPSQIIHEGPSIKMVQHAQSFRKVHKNTFIKSGRLYAKDQREFRNSSLLIQQLLKKQYVTDRSRRILLKKL